MQHYQLCSYSTEEYMKEVAEDCEALSAGNSLHRLHAVDIYQCTPCKFIQPHSAALPMYFPNHIVQGRIVRLWDPSQSVWNGCFGEDQGPAISEWLQKHPHRWTACQPYKWFDGCQTVIDIDMWSGINPELLIKEIEYTPDRFGVDIFKCGDTDWVNFTRINMVSPPHNAPSHLKIIRDCIRRGDSSQHRPEYRCDVKERPLALDGPWNRCLGWTVPFPAWILRFNPRKSMFSGNPPTPNHHVSFISQRTVGNVRVVKAPCWRSFHVSGTTLWLTWPLISHNRAILDTHWREKGIQHSIDILWACEHLEGMKVMVARGGEVVEMVDCMICGTITLTDSLFFTDSYVLPRMTDLFYINMAWMMHQQNTGSVTGGIPSLATLREDVLPEMYRI